MHESPHASSSCPPRAPDTYAHSSNRPPSPTTRPNSPPNRPTYALDFLLLQCHDTFKQEGLAFLSLSIAPLYGIGEDESDSRMLRAVFRYRERCI